MCWTVWPTTGRIENSFIPLTTQLLALLAGGWKQLQCSHSFWGQHPPSSMADVGRVLQRHVVQRLLDHHHLPALDIQLQQLDQQQLGQQPLQAVPAWTGQQLAGVAGPGERYCRKCGRLSWMRQLNRDLGRIPGRRAAEQERLKAQRQDGEDHALTPLQTWDSKVYEARWLRSTTARDSVARSVDVLQAVAQVLLSLLPICLIGAGFAAWAKAGGDAMLASVVLLAFCCCCSCILTDGMAPLGYLLTAMLWVDSEERWRLHCKPDPYCFVFGDSDGILHMVYVALPVILLVAAALTYANGTDDGAVLATIVLSALMVGTAIAVLEFHGCFMCWGGIEAAERLKYVDIEETCCDDTVCGRHCQGRLFKWIFTRRPCSRLVDRRGHKRDRNMIEQFTAENPLVITTLGGDRYELNAWGESLWTLEDGKQLRIALVKSDRCFPHPLILPVGASCFKTPPQQLSPPTPLLLQFRNFVFRLVLPLLDGIAVGDATGYLTFSAMPRSVLTFFLAGRRPTPGGRCSRTSTR